LDQREVQNLQDYCEEYEKAKYESILKAAAFKLGILNIYSLSNEETDSHK
jgi:hypothetical protein